MSEQFTHYEIERKDDRLVFYGQEKQPDGRLAITVTTAKDGVETCHLIFDAQAGESK